MKLSQATIHEPAGTWLYVIHRSLLYVGVVFILIRMTAPDTGASMEWPVRVFWVAVGVYLGSRVASDYPGLRCVLRWSLWSAASLAVGALELLALSGVALSLLEAFSLLAACLAATTGLFFGWWYSLDRRGYLLFAILAMAASLIQLCGALDAEVVAEILVALSALAPLVTFPPRLSSGLGQEFNPAQEAALRQALTDMNLSLRCPAGPGHF